MKNSISLLISLIVLCGCQSFSDEQINQNLQTNLKYFDYIISQKIESNNKLLENLKKTKEQWPSENNFKISDLGVSLSESSRELIEQIKVLPGIVTDKKYSTEIGMDETVHNIANRFSFLNEDYSIYIQEIIRINDSLSLDIFQDTPWKPDEKAIKSSLNDDDIPILYFIEKLLKLQIKILSIEEALLIKIIPQMRVSHQVKFDRIEIVAIPKSQSVYIGEYYEAELFLMATSSEGYETKMNGELLKVENSKAKVKILAEHDGKFVNGMAIKSWEGSIKINTPWGDTTLAKKFEYSVIKK